MNTEHCDQQMGSIIMKSPREGFCKVAKQPSFTVGSPGAANRCGWTRTFFCPQYAKLHPQKIHTGELMRCWEVDPEHSPGSMKLCWRGCFVMAYAEATVENNISIMRFCSLNRAEYTESTL